MTQGVTGDGFGDGSSPQCLLDDPLQRRFRNVMPTDEAGFKDLDWLADGDTHCQPHSRSELVYLRASPDGMATLPKPSCAAFAVGGCEVINDAILCVTTVSVQITMLLVKQDRLNLEKDRLNTQPSTNC